MCSENGSPLFSVIIPTHNRHALLSEAVGSVLSQELRDFECIVIDDGSETPVPEFRDHRVRVIRSDSNAGPAAARNVGLANASGSFVAFLDDDDLFTPVRLRLALEALEKAPVAVCSGSQVGDRRAFHHLALEGDVLDRVLSTTTPHLGQTAIRLDLAPRFDERFIAMEDVEWWLRVAMRLRVTTTREVGWLHRKHPGSRHLIDSHARINASLQLMLKHRDYFRTHRTAEAFRWKRIGLMANQVGDHSLARTAFRRSLNGSVAISTAWHLARSLRATANHVRLGEEMRTTFTL